MERILLAYDGSEPSQHAADRAAALAVKLGGQVTVLVVAEFTPAPYTVVTPGLMDPMPPALDTDTYERLVAEGVTLVRNAGAAAEGRLEWGSPADRIISVAEGEEFPLVVLGHRGVGGLESLLVGSVAKHVIDRAHCSVLVVR